MRGSPLLRALLAFAVLALLSVPIRRLTQVSAAVETRTAEEPTHLRSISLRLTITHIPGEVRVLHLGRTVWSEVPRTQELEHTLTIEYPEEGVELEFQIAWPENAIAAMRILMSNGNGEEHERTVWGRGPTSEVVTFP